MTKAWTFGVLKILKCPSEYEYLEINSSLNYTFLSNFNYLKVWMCGGTLLIHPCSHVGHVFRKQTPYTFPGGVNKVIFRNNRRLVDVWTDEYSKYFHHMMPDLNSVDAGDISNRIQLREKLSCKSFKWYLENIYPESPLPVNFYHVGSISNEGLNFCLDSMGRKDGEDVGASYCHHQGKHVPNLEHS